MNWFHTLRLKVLAILVAAALAAIGILSVVAIPAWPVVVGVVAAAALAVNSTASRLSQATCWSCGIDIAAQPVGEHGVACPDCGAVNQPVPQLAAKNSDDDDRA